VFLDGILEAAPDVMLQRVPRRGHPVPGALSQPRDAPPPACRNCRTDASDIEDRRASPESHQLGCDDAIGGSNPDSTVFEDLPGRLVEPTRSLRLASVYPVTRETRRVGRLVVAERNRRWPFLLSATVVPLHRVDEEPYALQRVHESIISGAAFRTGPTSSTS